MNEKVLSFDLNISLVFPSAPSEACTRLEWCVISIHVVSIGAFIAMNEQEIRLLLKELSEAFTTQISALQETQTARNSRHRAGIFAIIEYFELLKMVTEQRLKDVGFNLEGETARWFRWMSRNKLITSWVRFLENVRNRFGPCKYEDLQGVFSKLLQTESVASYQSDIKKLMNWCFNCDNKWVRVHKCPDKFLLLMADEDDDVTPKKITKHEEALESRDISILNSLIRHGSPRSLQLWAQLVPLMFTCSFTL
ncbi:ty3-gypsy retrotransposon protein [Tanacetum coccineum]